MRTGENYNQGKLQDSQLDELRDLFQNALADGRLSTKEVAQIQFFYYDSELSERDFATLKENVFRDVVHSAAADHQVTEQEQRAIRRLAKQLNISAETTQWAHEEISRFSAL